MRLSENILKLSQTVKEIKISYFEIFSQIFEQKKNLEQMTYTIPVSQRK